jgi:glycine dehydrogenase subunit 1
MAFIPHTPDDIARMLEVIGVRSVDELFDEIPRELRAGTLGVPPAMSEMEIARLLSDVQYRQSNSAIAA